VLVGHYGVGLAAKRFAPQTSLGTLVCAALFADLLAWALVIAGIEHFAIRPGITMTNSLDLYDYPISHSLATDFAWAALFAVAYYGIRRYWRGSIVIFIVVSSHWVLDFIAHRTDMPLAPGVHKYYGLGLYNTRSGMIVLEGLVWLLGIALYLSATRSKKRVATYVFWLGGALLTWVWAVSLKGLPPPGSIIQTGISSLVFMAVTLAWAYSVDHWRSSTTPQGAIAARAEQAG
jgi:hypothetical protein